MNTFNFVKTEGRYAKHCIVCHKLHKRGYRVENAIINRMGLFASATFICSKKCQNMYMLQNI